MIKLDGSFGEGGGQIIRTALALSVLTGKSFEVSKIRSGRPKPGLKNQHLFAIRALEELCDAETEGAELGSERVKFIPKKFIQKNLTIDIGTAGSITLLLQSLLLPLSFGNKKIKLSIRGGTDVKWSMPADYLNELLLPQLKRFADIDFRLIKRGYYPKGQGEIEIKIDPKHDLSEIDNINRFDLVEQGNLIQIKGISHASADLAKANVAERQAKSASLLLNKLSPADIRTEYSQTASTGSGITLWAVFSQDRDEIDLDNPIRLGADSLGERGKKSEDVGTEAAEKLIEEINKGAVVDKNLADNLIPFLGLVGGKIKTSEISNHTKTNTYVVEKFLDSRFEIRDNIILSQ